MASIFFAIVEIYDNQFKFSYLRNKTFLPNLLLHFLNLHQILHKFEEKDDPHSLCISESRTCERPCLLTHWLLIRSILFVKVRIFGNQFKFAILKKRWPSCTCLDKWLKSPVWEHRATVNILKGPKESWNLHSSTFIIFFHISKGNGIVTWLS